MVGDGETFLAGKGLGGYCQLHENSILNRPFTYYDPLIYQGSGWRLHTLAELNLAYVDKIPHGVRLLSSHFPMT